MNFFDIFSPTTINKVVDGVIDGADALVYTDEEKAKALQLKTDTKLKMLDKFEPFKIAQRYLAFGFALNFIFAFWVGVAMLFMGETEFLTKYLELISIFQLGWIMIAIVSFYFGGGFLNTFKGFKK